MYSIFQNKNIKIKKHLLTKKLIEDLNKNNNSNFSSSSESEDENYFYNSDVDSLDESIFLY